MILRIRPQHSIGFCFAIRANVNENPTEIRRRLEGRAPQFRQAGARPQAGQGLRLTTPFQNTTSIVAQRFGKFFLRAGYQHRSEWPILAISFSRISTAFQSCWLLTHLCTKLQEKRYPRNIQNRLQKFSE